ncbi:MAG: sulfatase [Bacteroidota bacterium]
MYPPFIRFIYFLGLCGFMMHWSSCSESPLENSASEVKAPQWPKRPNILWLVAEDLSPVIPPFGDSTVSTPNLSRLAAEGICYPNTFSPSGVCAPSRAAIALGMYPSGIGAHHMRTGPWFDFELSKETIERTASWFPEGVTIYEAMPPAAAHMHSEYLRRAGYYCTNNSKEDYQFRRELTAWDESSRSSHWRNRKAGQPFFSIFNFGVTHESQIWRKAEDSLWIDAALDVPVPPYLPANAVGLKDVRRMYSNIRQMDFQVGEILKALEEDGLLDSTIIFWYSDHGGPLPRQKRMLYDSGLRLPLIVRFPGQWRAGTVDSQLISFVDFKPTLLSLAGIQPPDYIQGRAWLGAFSDRPERQYIHAAADRFDAVYDRQRAVRDHRYKYIRNEEPSKSCYLAVSYREQMPIMQELLRLRDVDSLNAFQAQWFRPQKEPEELFDTWTDPHELHNLAQMAAHQEKLTTLRNECDRWMDQIKDLGEIPEPELIAKLWGGQHQPRTSAPRADIAGEKLALSCPTEGAAIGYQLLDEGEEVSKRWEVYQEPITFLKGKRLLMQAHRIGYLPSPMIEYSGLRQW